VDPHTPEEAYRAQRRRPGHLQVLRPVAVLSRHIRSSITSDTRPPVHPRRFTHARRVPGGGHTRDDRTGSSTFRVRKQDSNTEVINTIYDGTTTGSPARNMMVDLVCRNGTLDMLDGKAPTAVWHEDFVNDALTAFLTSRSSRKLPFPLSHGHQNRAAHYLHPQRANEDDEVIDPGETPVELQRFLTPPGFRKAPRSEVRRAPGF
jgi:hypothetical protein